ncbi:crotonase/enoyl-CoA hydratase family protein [Rhodococcus antarcticus]|jgi:enoyl-CoA hydratase|uniref:Crotonase/enoyl-CoA hydratase family protein n=1 Tax=Rhodococcus antarcticus TaxID=2987751 RepID=A0ABY6NYG7_9NOCA|nr:crotonase/enoyl-CoA hydratase family protein [Rhodococcus antarcticus]UZJ24434.1 crotonase/enoyl-CoA hydratase family protein [Rhodococcus antarcticus]
MTETHASMTVDRTGAVAQVTVTGPGKGNAMGPDFWRELPLVFDALDADPEVRAVVVAASGRNFSYGLDLAAMSGVLGSLFSGEAGLAGPRTGFLENLKMMQRSISAVADCRKPVVAAVQGRCIGGGVDLISACDIRFASADASFSVREVKVGIVADLGSLQRLPAIIGDGHLRELAMTGKDVDAARAERIGLVNEVFADAEAVLAAAHACAAEIAANPPLVVQGIKAVLEDERADRVAGGLRYVGAWNSAFMASEDLGEAVTAVLSRREPVFRGR